MNARQQALQILLSVIVDGRSLDQAISTNSDAVNAASERALARALSYGVLRDYQRLQALLDALLQKKLKAKDTDINLILCMGIYQLDAMRIPDHAAINESVILAKQCRKQWASGLVNAILRRFQREKTSIIENLSDEPAIRFSHPAWFIQQLQQDWPDHWQAILDANNQQAPMTLRVNLARQSREGMLDIFSKHDIEAEPVPACDSAITLENPVDVTELAGFNEGDISVQDAAAQQACQLLQPEDQQQILDACAAPGGKTAHILEYLQARAASHSHVVAIDKDATRLTRIHENLDRLGLQADVMEADASTLDWWNGSAFDRILLDAPCSATGVIRRHPDIKLHRSARDIEQLVLTQQALLRQLWALLKPGGQLLYATCSVLRCENAEQISRFLQHQQDASELPIEVEPLNSWGHPCTHGRQILPGEQGMDGFYYALLRKTTA